MKKKILTVAATLGLLFGGVAIGGFFSSLSYTNLFSADGVPSLVGLESNIKSAVAETQGASAAQVSQVHAELNTQMQYIQIRQNAEIIRLLGVIAAKK